MTSDLDGFGFELHGKTVGIVGVGHIGAVLTGILHSFNCWIKMCSLTKSCANATTWSA